MKKGFALLSVLALSMVMAVVPAGAAKPDKGVATVEKQVTVGTEEIHYYVLPEKQSKKKEANQTFLVLHGAFMSKGATDEVAEAINAKYPHSKVIQLDLPSHGNSTSTAGAKETVEDIASTVGEAVTAMRASGDIVGDLVPVGWSMGGSTAMAMELQGVPMKAIVLLNSAPEWSGLGFFAGMSPEETVSTFHGAFTGDLAIGVSKEKAAQLASMLPVWTSSPITCVADVKALLSFNIVDQLKNIDVPVTIISGDQDVVATVSNQALLDESIPDSKLYMIKGDGHTLLTKQGKEVAQLISRQVKN